MTTPVLKRLSAAALAASAVLFGACLVATGAKLHWFDWAFTPQGKDKVVMLLFGVTCAGLAVAALTSHIRRRKADRRYWEESQADIHDAWEGHPYVPVRSHAAVRPITDADLRAAAADLDAWEAEMMDSVEATLPESWTQATATVPARAEVHTGGSTSALAAWPEPLSPRLVDYATGPLAPQPMPARELIPYRPDPSWATVAPTYNGDAAEWRSERVDGLPVVDEQTYAAAVMVGFGRTVPQNSAALVLSRQFGQVLDAMPVSPAPAGKVRRAKGANPGTDAQRLDPTFTSWETPTGNFPILVAAMAGAS